MTARANRAMERLIGQFFESGEVVSVALVAGRMRRITLAVPELDWLPGQQIRVCTGDVTSPAGWLDGMRRAYSVWDYGAGQHGGDQHGADQHGADQHGGGLLSLCVLDHGDGPGARCTVGDAGPGGAVQPSGGEHGHPPGGLSPVRRGGDRVSRVRAAGLTQAGLTRAG